MSRVTLLELARARSGDKGDIVDLSLFARDDAAWVLLRDQVTAERVKEHFGAWVKGEVLRYEVPTLRALKFVLHGALDGGASRSIRSDPVGRCYATMLLGLEIDG